jgi:hypothetical protein
VKEREMKRSSPILVVLYLLAHQLFCAILSPKSEYASISQIDFCYCFKAKCGCLPVLTLFIATPTSWVFKKIEERHARNIGSSDLRSL